MSPDINGFIKENEIQVGGSERSTPLCTGTTTIEAWTISEVITITYCIFTWGDVVRVSVIPGLQVNT